LSGDGHAAVELTKNLNLVELQTCAVALSNGQWDPAFEIFTTDLPMLVDSMEKEAAPAKGRVLPANARPD
jgi:hypothetical protein